MATGFMPQFRNRSAPPFHLLAREGMSFAYLRMIASFGLTATPPIRGGGEKVLIIPGFMASDQSTARLRRSLNAAGFDAHGWGLGRNRGAHGDILTDMEKRLDELGLDGPVTLVGWSLGGLIAREFAKYAPQRIAKVITLGSPFSGDPRANNAWWLYERVAGHSVDQPPLPVCLQEKPPVPTIAFWSHRDGVVGGAPARGEPGESDHQIELDCTHMAFIAQPSSIAAIAAAIIA